MMRLIRLAAALFTVALGGACGHDSHSEENFSGSTPTLATSSASTNGGWLVKCPLSHTLPDDPIVFFQQPGVSHLHDFFANTTTDAASTYASMTASSATTTCPAASGDTAGYWIMALLKNGVKIGG